MHHPVMNNTKWNELRLAMYSTDPAPRWSTLCQNGHRSAPDREWYYHFRDGGYEDIVHVDIFADDLEHRERIKMAIKRIHLPGEETDDGFRIYGYAEQGQTVDYL
jgi:hypothetical protein